MPTTAGKLSDGQAFKPGSEPVATLLRSVVGPADEGPRRYSADCGAYAPSRVNARPSRTKAGPVARSDSGRADQRNYLAFVSAVNAKIPIGCDHGVVRIKLAHPDQTKIRQVWLPIRVALG